MKQLELFSKQRIDKRLIPEIIKDKNGNMRLSFDISETFYMPIRDFYTTIAFLYSVHSKDPTKKYLAVNMKMFIDFFYPEFANRDLEKEAQIISENNPSKSYNQALKELKKEADLFYKSKKKIFDKRYKKLKEQYFNKKNPNEIKNAKAFREAHDLLSYYIATLHKNNLSIAEAQQLSTGNVNTSVSMLLIEKMIFYVPNNVKTNESSENTMSSDEASDFIELSNFEDKLRLNTKYYIIGLNDDFVSSMNSFFTVTSTETIRLINSSKSEHTSQFILYLNKFVQDLHYREKIRSNNKCIHVSLNELCQLSNISTYTDEHGVTRVNTTPDKSKRKKIDVKLQFIIDLIPDFKRLDYKWVAMGSQKFPSTLQLSLKEKALQELADKSIFHESLVEQKRRFDTIFIRSIRKYIEKELSITFSDLKPSDLILLMKQDLHKQKLQELCIQAYLKVWKANGDHNINKAEETKILDESYVFFQEHLAYHDHYGNVYVSQITNDLSKDDKKKILERYNKYYSEIQRGSQQNNKIYSLQDCLERNQDVIDFITRNQLTP